MYYEVCASFNILAPVHMLRRAREKDDPKRFTLSTAGYQKYYGIQNTIKTQNNTRRALQEGCPAFYHYDLEMLGQIKGHIIQQMGNLSDDDAAQMLFDLQLHPDKPDKLDLLSRLKAGMGLGEGKGTTPIKMGRAQKRNIKKKYKELEEEQRIRKCQENAKAHENKMKEEAKIPKKVVDPDDVFSLAW